MKFDTSIKAQQVNASHYLTELANAKKIIEINPVSSQRSLSQNSYLHLLLGYFGVHFGYTLEEAKTIYKREANPNIFVYEKHGAKFLRSSADLTKEEMQISIDKFMAYSGENGLPLPAAADKKLMMYMENEIERNRRFL